MYVCMYAHIYIYICIYTCIAVCLPDLPSLLPSRMPLPPCISAHFKAGFFQLYNTRWVHQPEARRVAHELKFEGFALRPWVLQSVPMVKKAFADH